MAHVLEKVGLNPLQLHRRVHRAVNLCGLLHGVHIEHVRLDGRGHRDHLGLQDGHGVCLLPRRARSKEREN